MNNHPARGAMTLAFLMILTLCLSTLAPVAALASAAAQTPAATPAALDDSGLSDEEEDLLQDTFAGDATPAPDETAAPDDQDADNDDGVVIDPTDQEQFLTDLMGQLNVDDSNALDQINKMTHILLVGIDARPGHKTGRSDTMMLLTIDATHQCLKLTSFMRDLYVEIPGRKNNRLNASYYFGGPELLLKTLKKNFGVKIDYYAAVNFSLLADLIDQIGGLTLTIDDEKQMNYINKVIKEDNVVLKKAYPDKDIQTEDNLITQTGEQLLNGRQAQAYARYRKGSSDFQRTERQREVILKAIEKVKSMSMMDLGKLALNNLDQVNTNLTVADVLKLAPAVFQLKDTKVKQLRIPIDNGYKSKTISKMAVLVPDRAKNARALAKFLLK